METPEGPFCQSCAMPMQNDEHFGTNADGSKSDEYCTYCYQGGEFTEPNVTMQGMIERVQRIMRDMNSPQDVIDKTAQFIPMLKRWSP